MWTDLSLQPFAECHLDWATALERSAVMNRTWAVGGFVPHPGAHADTILNGAESLLVAVADDGAPQALVWIYRRTTSTEHVYVSLLADPAATPGFPVIALAGAMERQFRHQPEGQILIEVAEPNLHALGRLLGGAFEECARLHSAVWMDGSWVDLTVWRCDLARWRSLVGDADDPASAGEIVGRLLGVQSPPVAGRRSRTPSSSGLGHSDDQLVRSILDEVARRDPDAVDPRDPSIPIDLATPISEIVDSLGALVMLAVVADLAGADLDGLLARSADMVTFADLVSTVREMRNVAA